MPFSKNSKILIYTILAILIITFLVPIYSFAFDEDSIYVWSNTSSSVSTSTELTSEAANQESESQDSSR